MCVSRGECVGVQLFAREHVSACDLSVPVCKSECLHACVRARTRA